MSLTGPPLLVALALLTVAAPVTTYVMWSRLRGGSAVVVRGALLLTCQVSAVLLVAVVANDYGYFYTSWSELSGQNPARSPTVSEALAQHRQVNRASQRVAPAMRLLGDSSWSTRSQWPTRGRVESVQLVGQRSGLGEHAYVYLPPQYFAASWRGRLFPGVEVMTGYPGNERSLVTRMHYPDQELDAIRAHRAQPMVLVMLRPSVTEPRDTECTDVPGGPQAMTFFTQDVPVAVEHALRVRPTGWGVIGDSTGGYCATKLALMRSDVFTSAVSFSGYYHALHDATTGDLWGGSPAVREQNDPLWRLGHLPEPPISLFASIAPGEGGPEGYQDTMRLRRAVSGGHGPLKLTLVVVRDGGHNFAAWSALMPRAFSWLSAQLGTSPS